MAKISKINAIKKLSKLKNEAEFLVNFVKTKSPYENQEFNKWRRETEIAIEHIFGKETRHSKDFTKISFFPMVSGTTDSLIERIYQRGVETAITVLSSFIDEINEYWDEKESGEIFLDTSAVAKIELIIRRFHSIARKLQLRYADRSTIDINDEYDVQDLFSALLCLYFEDIRPEEPTPSCAGSASRVDFLLKKEKIVIEIKKTRQNLGDKQIGEQLIIDAQRYRSHPDCERLICFVYDPEGKIKNPRAIENDFKEFDGLPVSVFITPH